MTAQIIMGLLAGIIIGLVCGSVCKNIAQGKGYDEPIYFWLGFFFSLLGLMMVIMLPNRYR